MVTWKANLSRPTGAVRSAVSGDAPEATRRSYKTCKGQHTNLTSCELCLDGDFKFAFSALGLAPAPRLSPCQAVEMPTASAVPIAPAATAARKFSQFRFCSYFLGQSLYVRGVVY